MSTPFIKKIFFSRCPKDRGLNNLQNCLEAIRFALPHPLTPSPKAGEAIILKVKEIMSIEDHKSVVVASLYHF
jgi:hypothetical protein